MAWRLNSVLQTTQDVIWNQLVSLPFGIGALMFYWLLYRANLVPKWILVWGFISAPLFMAANLAHIKGFNLNTADSAENARTERGTSAGRSNGLPGTASAAGGGAA